MCKQALAIAAGATVLLCLSVSVAPGATVVPISPTQPTWLDGSTATLVIDRVQETPNHPWVALRQWDTLRWRIAVPVAGYYQVQMNCWHPQYTWGCGPRCSWRTAC